MRTITLFTSNDSPRKVNNNESPPVTTVASTTVTMKMTSDASATINENNNINSSQEHQLHRLENNNIANSNSSHITSSSIGESRHFSRVNCTSFKLKGPCEQEHQQQPQRQQQYTSSSSHEKAIEHVTLISSNSNNCTRINTDKRVAVSHQQQQQQLTPVQCAGKTESNCEIPSNKAQYENCREILSSTCAPAAAPEIRPSESCTSSTRTIVDRIIEEIIETEKSYSRDLRDIINGYLYSLTQKTPRHTDNLCDCKLSSVEKVNLHEYDVDSRVHNVSPSSLSVCHTNQCHEQSDLKSLREDSINNNNNHPSSLLTPSVTDNCTQYNYNMSSPYVPPVNRVDVDETHEQITCPANDSHKASVKMCKNHCHLPMIDSCTCSSVSSAHCSTINNCNDVTRPGETSKCDCVECSRIITCLPNLRADASQQNESITKSIIYSQGALDAQNNKIRRSDEKSTRQLAVSSLGVKSCTKAIEARKDNKQRIEDVADVCDVDLGASRVNNNVSICSCPLAFTVAEDKRCTPVKPHSAIAAAAAAAPSSTCNGKQLIHAFDAIDIACSCHFMDNLTQSHHQSPRSSVSSRHETCQLVSHNNQKQAHQSNLNTGNIDTELLPSTAHTVKGEKFNHNKCHCDPLTNTANDFILSDASPDHLNLLTKIRPEDEDKLISLFGNLEDIACLSESLLTDFNNALQNTTSKSLETASRIADIFIQRANEFAVYTDYCAIDYPRSHSLLDEIMSNKTMKQLLQQQQLKLNHSLPLSTYLLKPVQRILKYPLLLQTLLKNVERQYENNEKEEDNDESEEKVISTLKSALNLMTDYACQMNEAKRAQEELNTNNLNHFTFCNRLRRNSSSSNSSGRRSKSSTLRRSISSFSSSSSRTSSSTVSSVTVSNIVTAIRDLVIAVKQSSKKKKKSAIKLYKKIITIARKDSNTNAIYTLE